MNILQVISSSRTSGAEKHMVVLSEGLVRLGHSVVAVCPPGGWLTEQLRDAGIPSVEMPMHGMDSPRAIFNLQKLARENHSDLIHTHLTRATYLGYFAGVLAHVPVISTVHVLTRDFAYRHLPHGNHWFVAVSDYLRQAIISHGIPPGRVQTVYNGTDFFDLLDGKLTVHDHITPAASLSVRAELGLPADAQLVGQFGRVDSFKGAPLLVHSIRSVVERCPRAYFVFIGEAMPGVQQALWEMASSEGMDDRLRFTGVRNDVPRLMKAMDVVTLPSLTEACSMAIIEAMAMGKPVVATRAGGNLELIMDQTTGVLVDRNPDNLADAVAMLLGNPETGKRMGLAGQERARTMFSSQAMSRNMERLYQGIVRAR